ncbi:helix-turn-helix domain-containing protein [Gracilibacillus saliphilus]|uniref:helix-turn-helix domain-containing protein n=1 Tax=Gracilibacillus saliphilus TaxID=543890 RepID=UPI0013D7E310|nr:helix-turn-helix transcriptional regulator [Gracilibacillus saliphilus]
MKSVYEKGKLIRQYRKEHNWTQGKLANKVDTSVTTISRVESGKSYPSQELMSRIVKVLQIGELSHPEYHPLNNQLTSWQQSINQRNYATANKYYKELKKFPITYFYSQRVIYTWCNFQHALNLFHTDVAERFLEDAKKYADTLTPVNNYPFHKSIGLYYLLLDQIKDAFTYLNIAIKQNPVMFEKDGEIHLYYALAYDKIGQTLCSVSYASTALSIFQSTLNQPNILLSRIIKIKSSLRSQQLPIKNIIQELHTILDNYTSIYRNYIYYLLGTAYLADNDFESALKYCRKAIYNEKIIPLKVIYNFFNALIYALLEDEEMALDVIDGGKSLNKNKKYDYYFYLLKGIIQGIHGSENYRNKITNEIIPYFQLTGNSLDVKYCHAILGDIYYQKNVYKKAADNYYIYLKNAYISELLAKYPQK